MRALSFALALTTGCATTARDFVTGETTLNRFTIDEEAEYGHREALLFLASAEALGGRVDPAGPITEAVRTLAADLLAIPENRARMPAFPWRVHVLEDGGSNLLSFPGGIVIALSGLFRAGFAENHDELALLVAHELAHSAARHASEALTYESLAALGELGRFFGRGVVELLYPDAARLKRELGEGRETYSHQQELEADLIGLELMARAGYDPRRAVELWRRRAEGGAAPGKSQTHPDHRRRYEELRRHLDAADYARLRMSSTPPTPPPRPWPPADGAGAGLASPKGPLPGGPDVPSRYLAPPRPLLAVELDVRSEDDGSAPRLAVVVRAGGALYEDRLPVDAAVYVATGGRVAHAVRLAHLAPLDRPRTELRAALPALAPGTYAVTTRAIVGSLWTEVTHSLAVPPAAPWRLDPADSPKPTEAVSAWVWQEPASRGADSGG